VLIRAGEAHGAGFWVQEDGPKRETWEEKMVRLQDELGVSGFKPMRKCRDCREDLDLNDPTIDAQYVGTSGWGKSYRCEDCSFATSDWSNRYLVPPELRKIFEAMCADYEWTCPCCLKKTHNLQLDHIKPRAWGGKNTTNNIQPLCKSCNARKGARHSKRYPHPRLVRGTNA
jgi:hypothetical protein